jgi:hypothetical protein
MIVSCARSFILVCSSPSCMPVLLPLLHVYLVSVSFYSIKWFKGSKNWKQKRAIFAENKWRRASSVCCFPVGTLCAFTSWWKGKLLVNETDTFPIVGSHVWVRNNKCQTRVLKTNARHKTTRLKVQENCIHIIPLEQLPDGVLSHIFSFFFSRYASVSRSIFVNVPFVDSTVLGSSSLATFQTIWKAS